MHALLDGHYARACDMLAPHARAAGCAARERNLAAGHDADRDRVLKTADNADRVDVHGRRATVLTQYGFYRLQAVGDDWRLAAPDALHARR